METETGRQRKPGTDSEIVPPPAKETARKAYTERGRQRQVEIDGDRDREAEEARHRLRNCTSSRKRDS